MIGSGRGASRTVDAGGGPQSSRIPSSGPAAPAELGPPPQPRRSPSPRSVELRVETGSGDLRGPSADLRQSSGALRDPGRPTSTGKRQRQTPRVEGQRHGDGHDLVEDPDGVNGAHALVAVDGQQTLLKLVATDGSAHGRRRAPSRSPAGYAPTGHLGRLRRVLHRTSRRRPLALAAKTTA